MMYYFIKNKIRIFFTLFFLLVIVVLLHSWRNSSCYDTIRVIHSDSLLLKVKEYQILEKGSSTAKTTYYCNCSSWDIIDVTYTRTESFNRIEDIKYKGSLYSLPKERVLNSVNESIIIDLGALFRKGEDVVDNL